MKGGQWVVDGSRAEGKFRRNILYSGTKTYTNNKTKKVGGIFLVLVDKVHEIEHKPWWAGQDSNLRRLASADLQSAAIGHSATYPILLKILYKSVFIMSSFISYQ